MFDQEREKNEEFQELSELLRDQSAKLRDLSAGEREQVLAANAVLTSVQVIFYTRNENKDHDTRLECWINLSGEREAAYGQRYGEFSDWSTHVLYLTPKTNIMRKSDIPGSWLQIRIAPNGNDTWRFSCECTLYFSDGTVYRKGFPESTTLDQDSRQANKYL